MQGTDNIHGILATNSVKHTHIQICIVFGKIYKEWLTKVVFGFFMRELDRQERMGEPVQIA